MSQEHPDPTALWQFRRKHSFMAHYTMIWMTAALLGAEIARPGTVAGLEPMLPFAYGAFVLIILGYIANCAVEAVAEKKWK